MNLYFKHNKNSGESTLTYTSLEYSLQTLRDFLIVLDIYCATCEYCFGRYSEDGFVYYKEKVIKKR